MSACAFCARPSLPGDILQRPAISRLFFRSFSSPASLSVLSLCPSVLLFFFTFFQRALRLVPLGYTRSTLWVMTTAGWIMTLRGHLMYDNELIYQSSQPQTKPSPDENDAILPHARTKAAAVSGDRGGSVAIYATKKKDKQVPSLGSECTRPGWVRCSSQRAPNDADAGQQLGQTTSNIGRNLT